MSYRSPLLHDIISMSVQELSQTYGIEIDDDGVWDPTEGLAFASVDLWAAYIIEQEQEAYHATFEKRKSHRHSDEY